VEGAGRTVDIAGRVGSKELKVWLNRRGTVERDKKQQIGLGEWDGSGSRWNARISQEWKELAHVVDRLFFAVVFTLMTITVLIIVLVPFYKDDSNVAATDDDVDDDDEQFS